MRKLFNNLFLPQFYIWFWLNVFKRGIIRRHLFQQQDFVAWISSMEIDWKRGKILCYRNIWKIHQCRFFLSMNAISLMWNLFFWSIHSLLIYSKFSLGIENHQFFFAIFSKLYILTHKKLIKLIRTKDVFYSTKSRSYEKSLMFQECKIVCLTIL